MPVQINEIVIKATIIDTSSSGASTGTQMPKPATGEIPEDLVEQIIEIIKQKQER